jgi:cold shock protein
MLEMDGTVKWYNTEKGYGFIRPSHGGGDVFVHRSALLAAGLQDHLDDGQAISFDVAEQRGRPAAINLQLR